MSAVELDDIPSEADTLPAAIEAEQSVLGALFFDSEAWASVGDVLTADHFFDARNRAVFAVLSELLSASKPADPIAVLDRLRATGRESSVGGLSYLTALSTCVVSAASVRRHAEIVREKALRRALIGTADTVATIARQAGDAHEATDRAATMFADLQQGCVRRMPRVAAELMVERIDHWTALADGSVPPAWSTGLRHLDGALNGGLRPGKVYVIAARPSVGKSSLAQSVLLATARAGLPSLLLSQEMEAAECMDRATANVGGVDYEHLQTGRLTDDEWRRVSEATDTLQALPFFVDDEGGLTLQAIRAKAVALRRQGLKVLALDYLQLCDYGSAKGRSTNDALGDLSKGIKRLAKDLGLAVLLLSQLNRDVEKRASPVPTLADLRDSGAIEQDADAVLMLWRARDGSESQIVGLGVTKNRQGRFRGNLALEFVGRYQQWYESDADVSPQRGKAHEGGFE